MYKLLVFTIICVLSGNVYAGGKIEDLPPEIQQMLGNLRESCVGETGVTGVTDLIAAATNGDFKDDKAFKCYMKCLMTSIGVMEDDGTVDWDTYLGMLPEQLQDQGKATFDKCSSIKSTGDGCETAFLIHKCSYAASPDKYMLF